MATDREQLIALRKEIILSKMEGKSEAERALAICDLDIMNFNDNDHFMEYAARKTGDKKTPVKQATKEEIDAIMGDIEPGYNPKPGEASQSELDELFKHMGI